MIAVRKAEVALRPEVARFLHREMNPKIPLEKWLGFLDGRWAADDAGYAFVAEEAGQIVGVLSGVYADRRINGREVRTCNLSSWYILKSHRGGGLGFRMMSAALSEPGVTFTTYSSNPPALNICLKAGMTVLETHRMVWRPRPSPTGTAGRRTGGDLTVMRDMAAAAPFMDAATHRAIRDHAGLNVHPLAFRSVNGDGKLCVVVFSIKRKDAGVVFHEALHISDRALFAANARTLADAILPSEKALMSVDRRLLEGYDSAPDEILELPVNRGFRSAGLEPHEMDFLYSEIPLLDLKLY